MVRSRTQTGIALIAWILAAAPVGHAQVSSGVLLGEVRDPSGAVVAAAAVTAVHDATGFSFSAGTGAQGSYRIGELPPGGYTVTVAKPGFRTAVARKVILEVNQKARLDVVMQVGVAHDSVTVTAEVSPLQNDDASAGYRLDNSAIESLPLPVRNVMSLATLGPGAIPRQLGGFVHDVVNDAQQGPRGSVALNPPINGSRSTTNAFLLDGASDTDRNAFAIAVYPPMDSVQEFRIQTALPAAEFPQAGGGSGGRGHPVGRPAISRQRVRVLPQRSHRRAQLLRRPGAAPRASSARTSSAARWRSGRPARHVLLRQLRRTARASRPRRSRASCQTRTLRGGDFSGGQLPIFDPLARRATAVPGKPHPHRPHRSGRRGTSWTRYEPLPNRSTGATGNYLDTTPNRTTSRHATFRTDHQFRNQSRLFARYTLNSERRPHRGRLSPVTRFRERARAAGGARLHAGRLLMAQRDAPLLHPPAPVRRSRERVPH